MASTARLDELKKKFDENPRRYFAPLANEHRKSGDLDQAIALCRTHLPQQPGHISGHIVLAQALYEAGSLDESRDIFHSALGLDPENLIALRYLGDIARDTADVDTARTWYQRVLEVDPRNDEIVQMVRELDAPRPAPEAIEPPAADTPAVEAASSFAQPAAPAVPVPAPQANNDARFAPLSLEEIDLDETVSQPSASPTESHDAPEMDPFDVHPSASAESLFDASAEAASEDFFLTELSGAQSLQDESDTASHHEDSWAPEPAAETTPQAAAEETAPFEEGAFYLEPPPAAPAESISGDHAGSNDAPVSDDLTVTASAEPYGVPNDSAADATPGMDAFAAEYYAPAEHTADSPVIPTSTESFESVAEAESHAELTPSVADRPTAEWHTPTVETFSAPPPAAEDALGLEVMEFVPPSQDQSRPVIDAAADMDPVIGRIPEIASNDERVAPAVFVTETMAELYLQQGFRNEALDVYRELLARDPSDVSLQQRIEQIESGSISSVGMATVSENVVESALKRQSARPARSVRSLFASLASRRAPVAPPRAVSDDPREAIADAFADESPVEPAPTIATPEPVAFEPSAPQPVAETVEPPHADRLTPALISAAETLASFDPFADTVETESWAGLMPNEEQAAPLHVPDAMEPQAAVSRAPTPVATPVAPAEPASARRSLEDLFPDTPITARTEVAAQTLATAFGRGEPQGRPTRAASSELSLDNVFRGAPEGAQPADGGFSFDQFFSDSRSSAAEATASATSMSDSGRSGGSSDANDIEQFTAWLEGLKKK